MFLEPLSHSTLQDAIALGNHVFLRQPLLERISYAFCLSLQGDCLSQLVLRVLGVRELRYWVAMSDAKVVGFTGLYSRKDHEANWLGWTCVDEEYRGQGIGGKLLDFAIAQTQREGKQHLRLYTSSHPDFVAARRLYESRGLNVFDKKFLSASEFERVYYQRYLKHLQS